MSSKQQNSLSNSKNTSKLLYILLGLFLLSIILVPVVIVLNNSNSNSNSNNDNHKKCMNGKNGKRCENGGKATGEEPNCTCKCDGTGYTGPNCQTVNPKSEKCTVGHNGESCSNGGKATGMTPTCECKCVDGYTGSNCKTPPSPYLPYSCANSTEQGICCNNNHKGEDLSVPCSFENSGPARNRVSDGYNCAHLEFSGEDKCKKIDNSNWYTLKDVYGKEDKIQCCKKMTGDNPRIDCTYAESSDDRRSAKNSSDCSDYAGVWMGKPSPSPSPYSCANSTEQGICCSDGPYNKKDSLSVPCSFKNSGPVRNIASDGYNCAHLELSGEDKCKKIDNSKWYTLKDVYGKEDKIQCCRKIEGDNPRIDCTYAESSDDRRSAKNSRDCSDYAGVWM